MLAPQYQNTFDIFQLGEPGHSHWPHMQVCTGESFSCDTTGNTLQKQPDVIGLALKISQGDVGWEY